MRELTKINTFLKSQTSQFRVKMNSGTQEVVIETPDCRDNVYSVWGDWGPMYTIDLKPEQTIRILYRDLDTFESREVNLELKHLQWFSPVLATERKVHPFYINVFDKENGLIFHLYLDKKGNFSHAEALSVENGVHRLPTYPPHDPVVEAM